MTEISCNHSTPSYNMSALKNTRTPGSSSQEAHTTHMQLIRVTAGATMCLFTSKAIPYPME